MTLTEKVQGMTAKEIIIAMVQGLRNPMTIIDMGDFGYRREGVCYGCAATNTICSLMEDTEHLMPKEGCRVYFEPIVNDFESAINDLRKGDIEGYNFYGFAQIKEVEGIELPYLATNYTQEELDIYEQLANAQ